MEREMSRREFLKKLGYVTGGVAASATAGGFYLFNEDMEKMSEQGRDVIADLHVQPSKNSHTSSLLTALAHPGVTGIARTESNNHYNYEEVLDKFSGLVEEIDDSMAKVKGTKGYLVRAQELTNLDHHVLGVGFKGSYLEDVTDARKAVEEFHDKGGIAILNHPYITGNNHWLMKYRRINDEEERKVKELSDMVDEVEVHNAHAINPTYGIIVPNMKQYNEEAKQLAQEEGFKGTAATDARLPEQVKIAGIYVDGEELDTRKLQ